MNDQTRIQPPSSSQLAAEDALRSPPEGEPTHVYVFGSVAGAVVVICSALVVFAMLAILYYQIAAIEEAAEVTALDRILLTVSERQVDLSAPGMVDVLGRIGLETDAQYLRTARAQSLAGSRLTIQIIAELISLSLVVLGGALVFARIKSRPGGESLGAQAEGKGSVDLRTTFPGLILCALGAATVAWALYISIHQNFRSQTLDGSIYLEGAAVVRSGQLAETSPTLKEACERTGYQNPKCEGLK